MATIFQTTILNTFSQKENLVTFTEISLNFVAAGTIDNNSAQIQVMSWQQTGQ